MGWLIHCKLAIITQAWYKTKLSMRQTLIQKLRNQRQKEVDSIVALAKEPSMQNDLKNYINLLKLKTYLKENQGNSKWEFRKELTPLWHLAKEPSMQYDLKNYINSDLNYFIEIENILMENQINIKWEFRKALTPLWH